MRKLLLLSLCMFPIAAPPAVDEPVARIGDRTLQRDDYGQWLVDRYGVVYVREFVVERLLLERAEARGMTPSAEDVARRYAEEREHIIAKNYGGHEDRWLAHLDARGYSPEGWGARRSAELLLEMAQENMVRADRQPDEQVVEQRYRELYGEGGEQVALQALFFSAYRDVDPEDERPDLGALKLAALRRATEARERWAAGATLAELLPLSDPPGRESIVEGNIALYRRNMLGKQVEQAVASLDHPGDLSPPIEVFDGSWLLRLQTRTLVSLDDVRDDLVEQLRAEPLTSGEMANIQSEMLSQEGLEILLR
ncbi:MAG: peptidylprolyl isomerase [Planctomycetota bacterium]